MKRIYIDLGLHCTGYAVFIDGGLVACGAPLGERNGRGSDCWKAIVPAIVVDAMVHFQVNVMDCSEVVMEQVTAYKHTAPDTANELIELAFIGGTILGSFPGAKWQMFTPQRWKGNLPKVKCWELAFETLDNVENKLLEKVCKRTPKNEVEDVKDAVALGMFYEQRWIRA